MLRTLIGSTLVLTLFIVSSCGNTKKVVYFPSVKDGGIPVTTPFPESLIQKNDILSINVSSLNPDATAIFNTPNSAGGGATGAAGAPVGYLVNSEGFIQFPLIGNIKAEGLTKNQLKESMVKTLVDRKLLVDPIVTIRFVNFRVTVLGEVNHPTVVTVPNEKLSLLEAIGLAGDLTIYGKRQNVMIIREEKDQKVIKRVNLNSDEIFNSPYYYLQSNDIVYVEPTKAKVASVSRTNQVLPIVFSGLSLAIIAIQQLTNKD
ncbi:MAG: polysaccharide biosynthesis/export family protein [Chitinophagaceae bacterium]|nr:polysaccharide biosynthesis/export family protein [Chitinophagaceae bacterium]